jgi:carbon monoxide dehydrogenase subunit G
MRRAGPGPGPTRPRATKVERARRAWTGALGIALALAGGAAAQPGAPGAGAALPSADERGRLDRGEVVFRAGAAARDGVAVPGARGGVAFVRVPTRPEAVWALLTRPERYPDIFPGLRAVEVLESGPGPDTWLVRTDGKVGPFTFSFHQRYRARPQERTLTWRLDPTRTNDVFDDNWGWWRLLPEGEATLVVYAIGSIPSSWQPLAGYFERRGIIQALTALRAAAAGRPAA